MIQTCPRHLEVSLRARHWVVVQARNVQNNVFALERSRGGLYLLYWFLFITSLVTLSDQCELKGLPQKGIQNTLFVPV